MGIQSDLVAKRNELKSTTDKIAAIRKECEVSGGDYDLMKTKSLGEGDLQSRVNEMRNLKTKMDSLGEEVDSLVAAVESFKGGDTSEQEQKGGMVHSEGRETHSRKSLGERFTDSQEFKAFAALQGNGKNITKSFDDIEFKTLITTAAGFAPQAIRTGEVEAYPVEPIGLFDMIPKGQTSQSAYVFMRQNLRTIAAAEKAETAAYAESAFTWEQVSQTVEDIGHWVPITAAQLEDVPQIRGLIDVDLRDGIRERLDYQLYNGSGATPSLQGGLALSGINTLAADGETPLDAIYHGIEKCQKVGFAEPNMVAVNGENWTPIQLMKTDDGQYIWGHPSDIGPMRVWGRRVVSGFRIPKGTVFLGDFSKMLYAERVGITVEISDSHDTYFIYGKYAIRARTRGVFVWKRPSAFCKVTGIA